jgi:hypothetical protein
MSRGLLSLRIWKKSGELTTIAKTGIAPWGHYQNGHIYVNINRHWGHNNTDSQIHTTDRLHSLYDRPHLVLVDLKEKSRNRKKDQGLTVLLGKGGGGFDQRHQHLPEACQKCWISGPPATHRIRTCILTSHQVVPTPSRYLFTFWVLLRQVLLCCPGWPWTPGLKPSSCLSPSE